MNYMKHIANLFNLELGEPFTLLNSNGDEDKNGYIFTENGLEKSDEHINGIYEQTKGCDVILANMFRGYYDIKKIPWKPQDNDKYYFPNVQCGEAYATAAIWLDRPNDRQRYEAGMVCKTADESVEKAEKMLAALKED